MTQGTLTTIAGMANSFLAPVDYPDSDGEPMADTTFRRWYADRADVFVAGDRLSYFEEGNPRARLAPDLWTGTESLLRPDELGATVTELWVEVERSRAEAESARAEADVLRAKLLAAGIDPDA
jgi:hypothetical protein